MQPLRTGFRIISDVYWRFASNDGWAIASHIALSALLALFPFLIFLTALAGFLGTAELGDRVVDMVFAAWPNRVVAPIRAEIAQVLGNQRSDLLTLGAALMLWFSSSGVEAVRVGLNRAYGEEEKRWWFQTRAQSIVFVILGAAGLLALSFLIVLAPVVFHAAEALFPAASVQIEDFQRRILTSRYLVTILILIAALLSAHLFLPAGRRRLRDVWPGITFTLAMWIVAALAFATYLASFANYTRTYAGFASAMIALVFLYFLAVIFIVGGEFNAALLRWRAGLSAPAPSSIPDQETERGTLMSGPAFASVNDMADKKITFAQIGEGLYAFTAEGDPNTGIIIGDDEVMIVDAQATPAMAQAVIERVRSVTDKPITHVLLSHYHAVRVLGASAYGAKAVIASDATRGLIVERGAQDMASEIGRFPRLFRGQDSIPGLTWPSITFKDEMTIWLGKREVRIRHLGRGHTAGDTIAYVPDANVVFSGDLVEYKSACYCGDAHFKDWPKTLDKLAAYNPVALVPGRGDALVGTAKVEAAIAGTKAFLGATYGTVAAAVARGDDLNAAYKAVRAAMDGPFGDYAIYEHCLPFNVSRAYDEARGIEHPVIWTAERDIAMWAALKA